MNVLDSSAWIELIADGPNAHHFAGVLGMEGSPSGLLVPVICLTEVFKVVARRKSEAVAMKAMSFMRTYPVVDLDPTQALLAARLGLSEGLAFADSLVLACARAHRATLWTQDADFRGMEGVKYFPYRA